ncbi:hypothetical protein KUCAC02_009958 [Chaenocephalus aceratus]|uniref:Uncharacterized protein n=1 Tax=Chaenocephalus aceratus TaxID=36190 RepID=A0ACB9VZ87_CHAAC|nr:hypothetical protein KUCAC02_009958 [Chaenocephalus aceratus]
MERCPRHGLITQNNAGDTPLCPTHVMPSQAQWALGPASNDITGLPPSHTERLCGLHTTPRHRQSTSTPFTSPYTPSYFSPEIRLE